MKMIFLIVGLALGFGGGVYWGVHHPAQASQLSAEEERQFIQLQIKTTQAIKQKLDQLASRQASGSAGTSTGSGFISSGSAPRVDPEIDNVRNQQDQQLQQLQQRLAQLSK